MPAERCPVCAGAAALVRELPASFLRGELLRWSRCRELPDGLGIADCRLLRCAACGLEFSDPPRPGGEAFYRWVTGLPGYYPGARWEYGATLARIPEGAAVRLLDLGCGDGEFLARCAARGIAARGVDAAEGSVRAARGKGLDARCADVAGWLAAGGEGAPYDVVTAFHVLEHLADPGGFVDAAARLLAPGGRLYLSVPLSPQADEETFFLPLNNPPHHLTRWGIGALEALGRRAGLGAAFLAPPARDPLRRAVQALRLGYAGTAPCSAGLVLGILARHPARALRELSAQLGRRRVGGRAAPDLVLAELRRPQAEARRDA